MKTQGFQKTGIMMVAAALVTISTPRIFAQDTNAFGQYEMPPPNTAAETPAPPAETPIAPITAPTTPLSSVDAQILQLAQAKISDSTIITYIQNSSVVYGLDASQIVYMKQQGVSEGVINAMLNQRNAMAAAAQQEQQQQQQQQQQQAQTVQPATDQSGASPQYAVAQPSTPAPSTTVIVPDSQTYNYNSWASPYYYYPNYYPYYTWYWPVGYYGWGYRGYYGGYHGYYGGYHGYYGGGYHGSWGGGGGFHGSWGSGGGFHGGGGGGFHH